MAEADLTYAPVGATAVAASVWHGTAGRSRRREVSVRVGGADDWARLVEAVLDWQVKTRSGFAVRRVDGGAVTAVEGVDYVVTYRLGPLTVREPVRVVAVVQEPDRVGFAYGTLPGHPVSGEEAFVVHRDAEGAVWLTIRSLTSPGTGPWGAAYPALLVAQRGFRARYLRALTRGHGPA